MDGIHIAEDDAIVVPPSQLAKHVDQRVVRKVKETFDPLRDGIRVGFLHTKRPLFVKPSLFAGFQCRVRSRAFRVHHLHFSFDQRHMSFLRSIVAEVERRAQHTHVHLLGSDDERRAFVMGHLEISFSLQAHLSQPVMEGRGKLDGALGIEPHFRTVGENHLEIHAAGSGQTLGLDFANRGLRDDSRRGNIAERDGIVSRKIDGRILLFQANLLRGLVILQSDESRKPVRLIQEWKS